MSADKKTSYVTKGHWGGGIVPEDHLCIPASLLSEVSEVAYLKCLFSSDLDNPLITMVSKHSQTHCSILSAKGKPVPETRVDGVLQDGCSKPTGGSS